MNYGLVHLVTAHLPAGRPSCKKRRGSRTRRQPPPRPARQCGFSRGSGVRNPAPYKYENTRVARRHGCSGNGAMRFSGGSEPCVHRDPGADDWPCCLSRCRVDSTHSLPQHALLGRNLITVFQGVNTLAKLFSGAGVAPPGRSTRPRSSPVPVPKASCAPMQEALVKKHRENACFFSAWDAHASWRRCLGSPTRDLRRRPAGLNGG